MITISLVYDHRQRTPKGEQGPIEVRVRTAKKYYYVNTGVRVEKRRFGPDGIIKDVSSQTDDADMLNQRLKLIVKIIQQEINSCLENRKELDVAEIRKNVWAMIERGGYDHNADDQSLLAWIKKQSEEADISSATKKRYTTLINKLADYGKISRWKDLTVESIYAWDVWLRKQPVPMTENQKIKGMEQQTLAVSAVYNYHKLLKAMINRALKLGVINVNPYDRMKGVFKRGRHDTIDYLTEDQMRQIESLTPVPGSQVDIARDLFVFQMYTGLSYADTQVFDIAEYRQIEDKWVFIGQRVKTGVPYVSQLLPPVVDVLKKYGGKVPRMNNQRYNQMLKSIGMVIGIARLHSHMARHTFATWMLSKGAKIENVSRMLGHTNIIQTQRYAQVLAVDVRRDFDLVEKSMKKNNL